jgi:hypothetical protein
MKRLHGALARRRDCREWRDIGWIAAGLSAGGGKVTMPGLEGMPHRICEEILWQVRHSLKTYSWHFGEVLLSSETTTVQIEAAPGFGAASG